MNSKIFQLSRNPFIIANSVKSASLKFPLNLKTIKIYKKFISKINTNPVFIQISQFWMIKLRFEP